MKIAMNKGLLKNILIVLLSTIIIFSIFRYKVLLDEKYALMNNLGEARTQVSNLEKDKQNLLQDIEKRKEAEERLINETSGLKSNLKASRTRMTKLFTANDQTHKALNELNCRFSLLKTENAALKEQQENMAKENEAFRVKLSSIAELKKAIKELKKHKTPGIKTEEGNQGFVMKDGQPTYPAKVKIEVAPASQKE